MVLVETLLPAGVAEQRARLADQVERHVGQGDVFFEHRRVPAPLTQALTEDQAGVADAQHILGRGLALQGNRCLHQGLVRLLFLLGYM